MGLEKGQAGQGSCIPQWQAGRQQARAPGSLKVCRNVRGLEPGNRKPLGALGWVSPSTPQSLLLLCLLLPLPPPPLLPTAKAVSVFHFFLPLLVGQDGPPPLPPPATWVLEPLPKQTDGAVRQGWKGRQESPRTASSLFRGELRPGEARDHPRFPGSEPGPRVLIV